MIKSNPIRILHVTETLDPAGIESFIMNLYRRIDKEKVQFDFLVLRNQKEFYDEEILKLGGNKYCIVSSKSNTLFKVLEESKLIEKFLRRNNYKIIHIHSTTPLRAPYLIAAKKAGVGTRIYHSHSAFITGKGRLKYLVYAYMRKVITKNATDYYACSKAAGEWVFEKKLINLNKVKVIHNGLEIFRFAFSKIVRDILRQELKITDKYTLIHTGRFTEQKNQLFLLKVIKELVDSGHNVHLLLLGNGSMMDEVKKQAERMCVQDRITFLGVKSNVQDYLFAADCYVMPSLYEGLPVAGVEAQCAGLPCIFSKNITQEVAVTKNVKFLSLESSIKEWCDTIMTYKNIRTNNASHIIVENGYDMQEIANALMTAYINKAKENI